MEGQQTGRKVYPVTAGEYKLLEEIGQGVSATVYRAICLPFNEVVAIKCLNLEKCNSNLDDIRREAVTMTLINHPNVVTSYCSFVVDQSLWFAMPYMAGGSCLHIMKAAFPDGFEEAVISTLLKESLKALEYLHRQGHIHRDVKAGNILVDGTGAVKLGDFGVSACMFDTGDRQRSRKTFVGTPCWMAPEVMEQHHGYDYKADIWSFGITALELAHGHAPFSKYPPMKVLLMTLQNAPPGLDLERDKKFSKSFKEMIAMCLVKEPTKRPTAEKLLRHSFFKHARNAEYIYKHVLDGLPSLGERVKKIKISDASRLEQKKLPFDEQEERSQTEYKRGVSGWNFNVEDLKAQSALIPEDDDIPPQTVKEIDIVSKHQSQGGSDDSAGASPRYGSSSERLQQPVPGHASKVDSPSDADERVIRIRSGPFSSPVQPTKATNGPKSGSNSGRKEPKHLGRFDVFEDDTSLESPGWHSPRSEVRRTEERDHARKEREEHRKSDERERWEEQREHKYAEERERDESRRSSSGPLVTERVISSVRGRDEDRDRDKEPRQGGRVGDDSSRNQEKAFSGPLFPTGERAMSDHRLTNGGQGISRPPPGNKEGTEEKVKGTIQKTPVIHKGRFSVTSDDSDLEDPSHVSTRRNTSLQGPQQQQSIPTSSSLSNLNSTFVPVGAIMPHLQNSLHLAIMQQDAIMHMMNGINPNEATNSLRMYNTSKSFRSSSMNSGSEYSMLDVSSDRERDLLQQIGELQAKVAQLMEEYHNMKHKNISLERQLNAIYNKEEEERIRKEEAAKDDG